jgi:hypothetical protein
MRSTSTQNPDLKRYLTEWTWPMKASTQPQEILTGMKRGNLISRGQGAVVDGLATEMPCAPSS